MIILLHGFPEFWWSWRYQIEPLADAGFRVLVPDQRGYNLSDKLEGKRAYHLDSLARDVIGLADALGCSTFHLMGHDWGGIVAWWTASCYPERVLKLVAVNAPHPSIAGAYLRSHPSQALRSSYIGFFQIPRLPELMLSAGNHRALAKALQGTSRPGIFSDEDLAIYRATWSKPGALTAMLNWYRALPSFSAPSTPRLSMPVRIVWGLQDQALEKGLAEASANLCDDVRIRWLDNATHWVQHEEPDVFQAEVIPFLKEVKQP